MDMILNVDLDGVVYPFHSQLYNFIEEREPDRFNLPSTPMPMTTLSGHKYIHYLPNRVFPTPTKWEVWEDWLMSYGEWKHWFRLAVEDGAVWREGQPIPGSVEHLWRLSDEGWHIRIVTSRLEHKWAHGHAVANTAAWLDENNIPYREISFVKHKDVFAHEPNAFLVDDRPKNAVEFGLVVPNDERAILFDQPWNQSEPHDLVLNQLGVIRLHGWEGVYEYLNSRAN